MPLNPYAKERLNDLKKRALELQQTGMNMRQIGGVLGKSPAWVCLAVKWAKSNVQEPDSKDIQKG